MQTIAITFLCVDVVIRVLVVAKLTRTFIVLALITFSKDQCCPLGNNNCSKGQQKIANVQ